MPQQKTSTRDERRRLILDSARRVFETDGNLDGGVRRIASDAGYTTGAIYKMFASKEDIYAALLEDSLKSVGHTAAMAAATKADPEAALRASALAFIVYYQENKFEYQLGLYMFERDDVTGLGAKRDAKLNMLLEEALSVIQACFQRIGGPALEEARARDLSHALFASLAGLLALYFSRRDRSLKTDWRIILDTILNSQVSEARR